MKQSYPPRVQRTTTFSMTTTKIFTIHLALSIAYFGITNAVEIRTCSNVKNFNDINNIINEDDDRIKLICPFKFDTDQTINIDKSGITIVCSKENDYDECQFTGKGRHLNILGDSVTLVGFNFNKSKSGAVQVLGSGASFIDCFFKE